jgi:FkbH-like protein
LADLCKKTNQFNLALRRFNQAEVAVRLSRGDACVASVHLTDRLSDSGVIAVVVAERQGDQVVVEELCISCRAMGRELENTIILLALRDMPIFAGCREVAFQVQHGPRNQPALDWLAGLLDRIEPPDPGLHALPAQRLLDFLPAKGITIIKE